MNIKWKAISAVMSLIGVLFVIFILLVVYEHRRDIETLIEGRREMANGMVWSVESLSSTYYRSRIKSLVNTEASAAREQMVVAFRDRDRDRLYELTLPFFEVLKRENPFFSTFTWILPDNKVLLRMAHFDLYGDDVSQRRPDIVAANSGRVQVSGYAVAGTGLEYRVVQPIFFDGTYLGLVQFGLNGALLLDALNEKMPAEVGLLIKESRFKAGKLEDPSWPVVKVGGQYVQVLSAEVFQGISKQLDLTRRQQRVAAADQDYYVFRVRELQDYLGQPEGWLVVSLDITKIIAEQRRILVMMAVSALLLLPLIFLILFASFGKLLRANLSLTESLQQANQTLEVRVADRSRAALEQKQLLDTIINSLPDIIFLKDGQGRWLLANQHTIDSLGLDRSSYINCTDSELALQHPDGSFFEYCRAGDEDVWLQRRPQRQSIACALPDGQKRLMDVIKVPLYDDEGKRFALVTAARDMTEMEQSRAHEANLGKIIEASLSEIFILDEASTQFLLVNRGARQNLDYKTEEIEQLTFASIAPDLSRQDLLEKFSRIDSDDMELVFETCFRRKDGSSYPVEIHLQRTWFREKRAVMLVARDITIWKDAQLSLQKSEQEWRDTFDAIPDIITLQTPDMRILQANQAALDFFELNEEELAEQKCYELFNGLSEVCDGCPGIFSGRDLKIHSGMIHHKTHDKIFEVTTAPILNGSGSLQSLVHVAKDVTRQKALEESVLQAQKTEAIGTLAGGIAHDFNNILSAILGYAELLQLKSSPNADTTEDLGQIITAARRATKLVQQILTFSRRTEHRLQAVNLCDLVDEVLKILKATIPATITIERQAEHCGQVYGDPTKLHQVIMNLCTNALHAMVDEKGVLDLRVQRSVVSEADLQGLQGAVPGEYVVLSVSDTGHGMDRETMDRIFDPYFTTKAMDRGTGLGLAVTHGIVADYHGFITVDSTLGEGTTFRVFLPFVHENGHIEQAVGQEFNLPRGSESILVVDDELAVRNLLKALLEEHGYSVKTAADGEEALRLFRQSETPFALVITDQTMPQRTGAELAQILLSENPKLPVILCTGFSTQIDSEKAAAIGIRRFFQKPVVRTDLLRAVRDLLDKRPRTS